MSYTLAPFALWSDAETRPVGTGLLAIVARYRRRAEERHQLRQLLECEDNIFRDIGVSRHEVRIALKQASGRD